MVIDRSKRKTNGRHSSSYDRFGAPPGWNCNDVQFFIGRVGFDGLSPDRAAALNRVETRLKLPPIRSAC